MATTNQQALRAQLEREIDAARSAQQWWEMRLIDSLYGIKAFLEGPDVAIGTCMESFDEQYMLSALSIFWRNLFGKRPYVVCPMGLPNGTEIRIPTQAERKREPGLYGQGLILRVEPDPRSEGVQNVRKMVEALPDSHRFKKMWSRR